MHDLQVLGESVSSRPAMVGAIRHLADYCTLVWQEDDILLPEEEKVRHTGPLMEAPVGTYHLWYSSTTEPLIVAADKFILGSSLVARRDPRASGGVFVESCALEHFQTLLGHTERLLHVYIDDTGHQQYRLLWPNEDPGQDFMNHRYAGVANLTTGRVERP